MKFFVFTPQGEIGPYTVAQLNRMFTQKTILGNQLCRAEDSQVKKRLDEQFRHMSDTREAVAEARVKVAVYQANDGRSTRTTGGIMVGIGIALILVFGGGPYGIGFVLLVFGFVLIARGSKQEQRGLSNLPPAARYVPPQGEDTNPPPPKY